MIHCTDEQLKHTCTLLGPDSATLKVIQDLQQARRALRIAINTVDCHSINAETGEPLPWYFAAKAAIGEDLP